MEHSLILIDELDQLFGVSLPLNFSGPKSISNYSRYVTSLKTLMGFEIPYKDKKWVLDIGCPRRIIMKSKLQITILLLAVISLLTGCGAASPTYSVLGSGESFSQAKDGTYTKLDILWVIDNSGSMANSQQNLANNFNSFISGFTQRNYDFKIAVTTSDAFLAMNNPNYDDFYNAYPQFYEGQSQDMKAKFRDGVDNTHSGVFVLTPSLGNMLESVFMTNIMQGINGYGDERHLQSMRAALDSTHNTGFIRADSHLAVIMVTDEDDFSHDGIQYLDGQYTNPALHTIQSYVDYMDQLTGSSGTSRRYSVSSIAIDSQACVTQLNNQQSFQGRKVAQRVREFSDATGGLKGSLCDNFATTLENIANKIIELSTQFFLAKTPVPETIRVIVNGQVVPRVDLNPGPLSGGWYYNSAANSIVFQGDYIPPQGAVISVSYDPATIVF